MMEFRIVSLSDEKIDSVAEAAKALKDASQELHQRGFFEDADKLWAKAEGIDYALKYLGLKEE
jgi:hypothetical protein